MKINVGDIYRIGDTPATQIAQCVAEFNVGEKVKVLGRAGEISSTDWYNVRCANGKIETVPKDWLEETKQEKDKKDIKKELSFEDFVRQMIGESMVSQVATETKSRETSKKKAKQKETAKEKQLEKLTLMYDGSKVVVSKGSKTKTIESSDDKHKIFLNLVDSIYMMCGDTFNA